ncbi:FecCD family ABC transporter permease [Nocardia sp. NPDC051570]|uniref:FecCD family ABC transporter permease n=1 Tax=Nocardia sp. NPDC051570 TaxID=3364324 RepID=UPI003794BC47
MARGNVRTVAPPLALGLLATGLAAAVVGSLLIGSGSLTPVQVWQGLSGAPGEAADILRTIRIPRTVFAVIIGAALGLAGALTQGYTRNPLADPGLLGITQGAALAVVLAITLLHLTSPVAYVWFAFGGAALAAAMVFTIAGLGSGASPLSVVLVGAGISVSLSALTGAIALSDRTSMDALRFWGAGSVGGLAWPVLRVMLPFLVIGFGLAALCAPVLNALDLGDDVAAALGVHVFRGRLVGILTVTLLAGAATAACGSIAFLGLMVPHVARSLTGPDFRWLLPCAAALGAVVLLAADIVGRVVARPGELQAGIVVALLGAPFFLAVVLLRKAGTR